MSFIIEGAGVSHLGTIRPQNEDNIYLFGQYRRDVEQGIYRCLGSFENGIGIASVCDGVGGEANGEEASLAAVERLRESIPELSAEMIRAQVMRINADVVAKRKQSHTKMGCTFTGLYTDGNRVYVCNVGDSKIYLLRDEKIYLLSMDHTEVAQQIRLGIIKNEDQAKESAKHRLTQNIGISPDEFEIEPFISGEMQLKAGDVYMLCSDGLTDVINDDEKKRILMENRSPVLAAEALVNAALSGGSKDNTTVLVLKVTEKDNEDEIEDKERKDGIPIAALIAAVAVLGCVLGLILALPYIKKSTSKDEPEMSVPVEIEDKIISVPKEENNYDKDDFEEPYNVDDKDIFGDENEAIESEEEEEFKISVDLEETTSGNDVDAEDIPVGKIKHPIGEGNSEIKDEKTDKEEYDDYEFHESDAGNSGGYKKVIEEEQTEETEYDLNNEKMVKDDPSANIKNNKSENRSDNRDKKGGIQ